MVVQKVSSSEANEMMGTFSDVNSWILFLRNFIGFVLQTLLSGIANECTSIESQLKFEFFLERDFQLEGHDQKVDRSDFEIGCQFFFFH